MLAIGDRAPNFELPSDSAGTVDSATLAGRRHVLFFYPKDDTSGCTAEVCALRDLHAEFAALDVTVYGVSGDPVTSHQRFAKKYGLNFPLLADPQRQLIEAYGVWVEKSLYGRKYFGTQRATFAIGSDGRIEQVWPKVKVPGHIEEVLAYVRGEMPAKKRTRIAQTTQKI